MTRMPVHEYFGIKPKTKRIRHSFALGDVLKLARKILDSNVGRIIKTIGIYSYVYRFE